MARRELRRGAVSYVRGQNGPRANTMRSRNLHPDDSADVSRAATGAPHDPPGSPETAVKTLPAALLVKMLASRLRISTQVKAAQFVASCSRLGSRMRNRGVHDSLGSAALGIRSRIALLLQRVGSALTSLRRRRSLAFVILIALVPVSYTAYCIATIPFAASSPGRPTPSAMVFEGEDGKPFATRGVLKGHSISADQIPPVLASAVTAIEDHRFYQHGGLDLRAMTRAAWHDFTGRRLEGGSTITQQLARRLYLSPERTLKRKVQEAALATWLNLRFSKNQILARYLDTAYFGDGAYGVDSAALRYFGKNAQQLSLSEAALLAGLIRAPSELEPNRNSAGARQRADVVLDAMVENGALTQQEADAAKAQPAVLRVGPETPPGSNYFLDAAANEAKAQAGASSDDLTVRTTINPELQHIAESVVAKRLAAVGEAKNISQAALVALAPDGAILAMVGGRDYNTSQFNRVTQARRQPGSLFKAFVYLAALRKGYTPDSTFVDQPVNIGDWEPDNYGDHYYGQVTLRTAFAHSLNSVAVQLAQAIGIPAVIDTAKQLGVRSDLPAVPSVALGSAAVTPLEMTRAFAAIAMNDDNGESYAVREIGDGDRRIYVRPAPQLASADNPAVHAEMLDLLTGVVREGTGTAAQLDRPVGGKTGTSEDYRDAWFVGFTSDLVVGVWVGNDDNTPMNSVTGGSIPASIWHDFVSAAESVRGAQPTSVTAMGSAVPTPTISFSETGGADAKDGQYNRRPNDFGFLLPFRLFGFRF
jgi:penicillin-binding protein 1A